MVIIIVIQVQICSVAFFTFHSFIHLRLPFWESVLATALSVSLSTGTDAGQPPWLTEKSRKTPFLSSFLWEKWITKERSPPFCPFKVIPEDFSPFCVLVCLPLASVCLHNLLKKISWHFMETWLVRRTRSHWAADYTLYRARNGKSLKGEKSLKTGRYTERIVTLGLSGKTWSKAPELLNGPAGEAVVYTIQNKKTKCFSPPSLLTSGGCQ